MFSNCFRQVAEGFQPIAMGAMPENIDNWVIRGDQLYLYRMVVAVNNGECDKALADKDPGVLSTSRWLTTAASALRYYVTQKHPSPNLKKLVEFIVKVYAPFWFLVKNQPQAIHGSRHVFAYISWIRQLPMDVQSVVRPVIHNNAYFFHPENILLSMITDPDPVIRADGYEKIMDARSDPPATIRQMYIPKKDMINFQSDTYTTMIDWTKIKITEPPCLLFYTQSQLQEYQYSDEIMEIPGKNFVR